MLSVAHGFVDHRQVPAVMHRVNVSQLTRLRFYSPVAEQVRALPSGDDDVARTMLH